MQGIWTERTYNLLCNSKRWYLNDNTVSFANKMSFSYIMVHQNYENTEIMKVKKKELLYFKIQYIKLSCSRKLLCSDLGS
jgi:hypothetical protein